MYVWVYDLSWCVQKLNMSKNNKWCSIERDLNTHTDIKTDTHTEMRGLALTECTMEQAMRQECQYTLWALPRILKHAAK